MPVSLSSVYLLQHTIINNLPPSKIHQISFKLGYKYAAKLSDGKSQRYTETLDIVKFLCRDFWNQITGKQIDSLSATPDKLTFMLKDANCRYLTNMGLRTVDEAKGKIKERYSEYLRGLVEGGLNAFGIEAKVDVSCSNLQELNIRIKEQLRQ